MVKDLTTGNPLKLILLFSLPMVVGNLFQQFYNMADSIVVGQFLGVNALAAVGSTGSISFLVLGFATGTCSGLCIPVAQAFGAGDHKTMRRYVTNSVYIAAAITVLITAGTLLFTRQILVLMQTPADIFEDAYAYIIVVFAGTGALMLYNLLSGVLRALGDSKTPLYFLIVASVLNVGLDVLFIVPFRMGTAGAAYATVIAQAVSGLLCLVYIWKRFPILRMKREDWRPDAALIRRMLAMGVPMGLQFSLTAVGSILLQTAVNGLGSGIVAAVTAAGKVSLIVTQPMETIGLTMATYCGQNLGAGKIERIHRGIRTSVVLTLGYSVAACLIVSLWGGEISRLFISGDDVDRILEQIRYFLIINGLFYPLLTLIFIFRNSLQGLGSGIPAMTAGIFELVGRSFVAFCLVGTFGFNAVCFANPAAWVAADLLLLPVYFVVMRRLRNQYPPQPED
ncbi:MAG: MATE family efflux transporter [Candidatus Merdivicinus sp.]